MGKLSNILKTAALIGLTWSSIQAKEPNKVVKGKPALEYLMDQMGNKDGKLQKNEELFGNTLYANQDTLYFATGRYLPSNHPLIYSADRTIYFNKKDAIASHKGSRDPTAAVFSVTSKGNFILYDRDGKEIKNNIDFKEALRLAKRRYEISQGKNRKSEVDALFR